MTLVIYKGKFDGRTVTGFKEGKKMKITKRQLRKLIQEQSWYYKALPPRDHWDTLFDALEAFVEELGQGDADFDEDAKRNVRQQINSMLDELGV